MLKLQEQLQSKLADQDGSTRRENVRIYAVPEGAEDGSGAMIPFMERLLKETLEIPDMKDLQIERANRALAPQPPTGAQPRSILVKFLSFRVKEEVLKMAWQKKGFSWRNCKINLDHDYAPYILARRKRKTLSSRPCNRHGWESSMRTGQKPTTQWWRQRRTWRTEIACKSYCTAGISSLAFSSAPCLISESSNVNPLSDRNPWCWKDYFRKGTGPADRTDLC